MHPAECSPDIAEFQTVTPYGEDVLYRVPGTDIAVNKEILSEPTALSEVAPDYQTGAEAGWEELKAIEVGNIFKLGTRFSDAFGVRYADREGKMRPVIMGCYGLGPSRVMGTIAECLSDERGLVWPEEVAPYRVDLGLTCTTANRYRVVTALYDDLNSRGIVRSLRRPR